MANRIEIKHKYTRFILTLILSIFCANTAAIEIAIDDVTIDLPSPSGFSGVTSPSDDTVKMFRDLLPAGNFLHVVFLTEGDLGKSLLGEPLDFDRYILVLSSNEFDSLTITKPMFKEIGDMFRKQHETLFIIMENRASQLSGKASDMLSDKFDVNLAIQITGVVSLGIDFETASSIAMSTLAKSTVSVDNEDVDVVMAQTMTFLLIKGKVLQVCIYKLYHGENDIEWTRKTAKEYANQILSANQTSWPLATGSIVPEGITVDPITKELLAGDYTEFSLKSHPKAHGLDIVLKYPQSWKAEEGIRPHIVHKFTGKPIGGISPSCMVVVQVMPSWAGLFLKGEIAEEVLTESVQEFVPEGSVFINSGQTKIDGEPCMWLKYYHELERAGVRVGMYVLQYIMFYDGRMFAVQCGIAGLIEDKEFLEDAFNSYLPVFQMIGNSIVITEKWTKPNKTGKFEDSIMKELFGEYWFLALLLSAILTWGIGLAPPVIIRYAILRRPISKKAAIPIVIFFWFVNIVIFTALGSQSKTHAALFLVALASYYILHRRYDTSIDNQSKNITKLATVTPPQEEKITEESPPKTGPEIMISGRLEKCSNCKRMIGKLEHSYVIEESIVCVKCYQVLNSENN